MVLVGLRLVAYINAICRFGTQVMRSSASRWRIRRGVKAISSDNSECNIHGHDPG